MPSLQLLTRASTTFTAQVLSSVTNFLVGAFALAAAGNNLAGFGRFAIGFQLSQVIIAVAQSSTGSSLLVHSAAAGSDPDRSTSVDDLRAGAATATLVLGTLLGIPIALAGVVAGGQQGQIFFLVAAGSPWLAAQYTLREERFARFRPGSVVAADAIWLGVLLLAAMVDHLTDWDAGAKDYLSAWFLGAALSALPLVRVGLGPGRAHLATFWRTTGPQAVKLGAESFLARSVTVVALISTDRILGTEAAGFLAAAVLVFSPMSVVHASAGAVIVPAAVRRRGIHIASWRLPMKVFAMITVITLAWATVVWAFNMTRFAFGPFDLSANGVSGWLFLAMLTRFVAMGFWRGPGVALRVADAADASLRARVTGVLMQWSFPVIGLVWVGLEGGAFGLAIATWIGGAVAWSHFLRLDAVRVAARRPQETSASAE